MFFDFLMALQLEVLSPNIGVAMKKVHKVFLLSFAVCLLTYQTGFANNVEGSKRYSTSKKQVDQIKENLRFPFVENSGQFPEDVLFYTSNPWGGVWVTRNHDIVYSIIEGSKDRQPGDSGHELVLIETMTGGNGSTYFGKEQLPQRISYFKGNKPDSWSNATSSFNGVQQKGVYKHIDIELKARNHNVEKIFHVYPGGNPADIRVRMSGADQLLVNANDELEAIMGEHRVQFTQPVAYQENLVNGKVVQEFVTAAYTVAGSTYSFDIGPYDHTRQLIIDPLLASTYIGGEGFIFPYGALAIDANSGNVCVGGATDIFLFPTTPGVYDRTGNGSEDIFIACFNDTLDELKYATFMGGEGQDWIQDMAFGSDGNLYCTGLSNSDHFPTTDEVVQPSNNGGSDAIIIKMSPDLSSLTASTYLGGNGGTEERGAGIWLDESDNVFIVGTEDSAIGGPYFPTTPGAYDRIRNESSSQDVFVAQLDSSLETLIAATLIGGESGDWPGGIIGNGKGDIFISGSTSSSDFPIPPGGYDASFNLGPDIFVARFDTGLTTLKNATFLGGSGDDSTYKLAIGKDGSIYLDGITDSDDFPVTDKAYSKTPSGAAQDGIVARFSNDLSELKASTFLGQGNWGLATDRKGNIHVAGSAEIDLSSGVGFLKSNVLYARLNADLSSLLYSTHLGGSSADLGMGVDIDQHNNVYLSGVTLSSDFPVTGPTFSSGTENVTNVFVAKYEGLPFPWPLFIPRALCSATNLAACTDQIDCIDNGGDWNGQQCVIKECNTTTKAGRNTPEVHSFEMGKKSGSFDFYYQTYVAEDQILIKQDGKTIFDSGCVGKEETVSIDYSGSSSKIVVEVSPNCQGDSSTGWTFTVNCPN